MNPPKARTPKEVVDSVAVELSRACEHISDAKTEIDYFMDENSPAKRTAWGREVAEQMSDIYYSVANIANNISELRRAIEGVYVALGGLEDERAEADSVSEPPQIDRPGVSPPADP